MKYLILTVSILFLAGCSQQQETIRKPILPTSSQKIDKVGTKIGLEKAASLHLADEYEDKTAEAIMQIEMEGRK